MIPFVQIPAPMIRSAAKRSLKSKNISAIFSSVFSGDNGVGKLRLSIRSPCTLPMAHRVVWIWISAPKATRAGSSSRRLPGRPPVELSVPLSRTSLSLIREAIMRETWGSDSPLCRAMSAPDRCLLSCKSRSTAPRPALRSHGDFSFCPPTLLSISQLQAKCRVPQ